MLAEDGLGTGFLVKSKLWRRDGDGPNIYVSLFRLLVQLGLVSSIGRLLQVGLWLSELPGLFITPHVLLLGRLPQRAQLPSKTSVSNRVLSLTQA